MVRLKATLVALGLVAGSVFAVSIASASTPASGSVTVPSTVGQTANDTWTGSIPPGSNGTSDCAGLPDAVLDHHMITVTVPAGVYSTLNAQFTFTISWTPGTPTEDTADEILTVIGPDGSEVGSSDGGSPTETVAALNLPGGVYDVEACGFVNALAQPYDGKLEIKTLPLETTLASAPAQGLQFSAAVPADAQRDESEPLIDIDKAGNMYTCGPTGFSQGADYAQVSTDGGDQFHLLGDPPRGQQSSAGGGDCGIATAPVTNTQGNYPYAYAGLGALSGFATSTSPNNGHSIATFGADLQGGVTNQGVGADRQWLTFLNDNHTVLMSYNQTEPHNTVVIKSTDGGLTYDVSNAAVGAPSTRFPGPMHYDPVNNVAFFAWDRGATGGGDSINLSISSDGGTTWKDCRATVAPANANGFVVADSDGAGNIYVAYGEQSSFHTYLVTLTAANVTKCNNPVVAGGVNPTNNPGFSAPVQVDRNAVRTTVFPWLVASGQPGRVAVAFYGTESDGDSNSGSFKASWDAYVNQSLNALSTDPLNPPTFSQVKVTTHPFHYDSICLSGLACDLAVPAGDRTLADFFAIDYNPVTQKLGVVFNRTNKKPDESLGHVATPMVTTQTAGPKNGGGTLGTSPPQPLVRTSSTDPTGDALSSYSTLAPLTPPPPPPTTNEPAADFTSVSVGPEINLSNGNPITPGGFTVTMKVADLSTTSLATTAARTQSSSLLWAFRFTNGYQDAAASARWNASGFTFGFNDYTLGSTPCESGSTPESEKCVVFPGGTPILGDANQTTGTIRLSVPLSLLRGLSGPTGAGQRPVEVPASAGTRLYDGEALSMANASADQNAQSFLYPLDNTPAMDFLLPSPDLAIGGTDTPDPVYTGDDLTYTLNAVNGGVSSATGVTLTDTLPSGVVFESATATQGTCSHSGQTVTCNLGNLAGAATATVTIVVAPTAGGGTYTNQASVAANQPDPNLANNAISITTTAVGAACTIIGTPANDTITGTSGNNVICGIGGNDTIHGGAGNDVIVGGAGNDSIFGDDGNDNIIPGLGTDSIDGGAGSDTVNYIDIMSSYGVPGVNVNLSTNSVTGGAGSDTLAPGTIENATGSPQDDTLTGDGGANTLLGGAGNDTLSGGAGNDYLGGSAGNDSSSGGDGNDILAPGTGDDSVDGGAGSDTVTYISEPVASGVNVNLTTNTVTGGAGNDTLANIENATGTQLDDTLTGDAGPNVLLAAGGNDTLAGNDGNDFMTGGPGVDSLSGGAGDDGIAPGPGNDTAVDGGAGVDNITYFDATSAVTVNMATGTATGGGGNDSFTNFEKATGSPFGDTLIGDAGNNTLLGGAGDDLLQGGAGDDFLLASIGNDTLQGGDGNDRLAPGLGNDAVDGGNGTDLVTYLLDVVATGVNVNLGTGTVTGGAGTDSLTSVEQVTGSTLDDTLTGSAGANQLFGVGGNDSLSGLDGNDYLAGGAGNDAHNGGNGTDVCQDSSGTNTFVSCESTPAVAQRQGSSIASREISYELSVGRWVAREAALERAALQPTR